MSEIINRIDEIIFDNHLNDAKFERLTGKSTGYLNTLRKSKKRSPGTDFIVSVINKFPDYSLNWIVLGEGPKKTQSSVNLLMEDSVDYSIENKGLLKELEKFVKDVVRKEMKEPLGNINQDILVLLKRTMSKENERGNIRGKQN